MRRLIAGNWKMNGILSSIEEAKAISAGVGGSLEHDVLICPPATLLHPMVNALTNSNIAFGGQDCHANFSGAHTGDISPEMLKDLGATYVIVGHSERRADHGETNAIVREKALSALKAGLTPIICIGESLEQRDAGQTMSVLKEQILGSVPEALNGNQFVIAYEPVWAIGTGKTASINDIAAAHAHIGGVLASFVENADACRLLYGGSVKPSNAAEILGTEGVHGALVGGASLKASDFLAIVSA